MTNSRMIKASELRVGSTFPGDLENRVVIDVSMTRYSVVVRTVSENPFPLYPKAEAQGVYQTFRKTSDVEVIDHIAMRQDH